MKQNGISLNATDSAEELNNAIGDGHYSASLDTPTRADAFEAKDEDKVLKIAHHFEQIMHTLGLDLNNDSLKGTPGRVAKMYVHELFSGLNPKNEPTISLFKNSYRYNGMLIEKNITVQSYCEHHFVPITGLAQVAYIPNRKVIGLSKINRLVQHYARRPQVQERLTEQVAKALKDALHTEDVAVIIDANHMCLSLRGIQDQSSSTVTNSFHGKFKNEQTKTEFFKYLD